MAQLNPDQFEQRLPLGEGTAHQFEPVGEVQKAAAAYTKAATGRQYVPPNPQLQVDPAKGFAVQREYRRNQQSPPSMRTVESYKAMSHEIGQQYEHMTRPVSEGGLGIHHEVTPHDPYRTPQEMAADVRQGRIKTLATATTGGHGFFSNLQNDQFRAVHDVFGHAATGRGFSRHGEEAAWRSHVQMFSPQAREAMTSETRGQNSVLNYGRKGQFIPQGQAVVGLSRLSQSTARGGPSNQPAAPQSEQPRLPGLRGRTFSS